ncbi:MAG: methylmalonyl-CoA epimerase [Deltaproteobacteria bacterium]|nr:methylmalonyl-CoA epimerase [Deltaproteobacteria bacterium]
MTPECIHHLGIVVRDLDQGLAVWRDGLGLAVERIVELPDRGLKIAFLPCGPTTIELIAPLHDHSEVSKFLYERGGGLHHVCLQVPDIAAASAQAADHGLRMLGDGPKPGAEGFPVRFAHPKTTAGALVELLETTNG